MPLLHALWRLGSYYASPLVSAVTKKSCSDRHVKDLHFSCPTPKQALLYVTSRTFRETTSKRPQNEIPGVSRSVSHLFAAAGRPTSPLGMMSHAFLFSRERKKGVSSIRSQKWAGTALFARRTSHLRLRQSDSHQKNIFIKFDGGSLSFL